MNRIKRFILLTAIGLCTILLACDPLSYRGEDTALYSVGVCAIPGAGYSSQIAGYVKKLETDQYGRELFIYSHHPIFYDINAYVICQQYDEESAYYYQDICFELWHKSLNVNWQDRVEALKERNDWDKPLTLDDPKVRRTRIFDTWRYDGVWEGKTDIEWECSERDMKPLLAKYAPQIFKPEEVHTHCFDIYEDGRALYIVKAGDRLCIVATHADGSIYRGSPLWLKDPYTDMAKLVEFRAEFEAAMAK